MTRSADEYGEEFDDSELSPDDERDHALYVRRVADDYGFPLSNWALTIPGARDSVTSGGTSIGFGGGEVIETGRPLGQVQRLVQAALDQGVFLEIAVPDGRTVVINPGQIKVLQDSGTTVYFGSASLGCSTP